MIRLFFLGLQMVLPVVPLVVLSARSQSIVVHKFRRGIDAQPPMPPHYARLYRAVHGHRPSIQSLWIAKSQVQLLRPPVVRPRFE